MVRESNAVNDVRRMSKSDTDGTEVADKGWRYHLRIIAGKVVGTEAGWWRVLRHPSGANTANPSVEDEEAFAGQGRCRGHAPCGQIGDVAPFADGLPRGIEALPRDVAPLRPSGSLGPDQEDITTGAANRDRMFGVFAQCKLAASRRCRRARCRRTRVSTDGCDGCSTSLGVRGFGKSKTQTVTHGCTKPMLTSVLCCK